MSKIAGRCYNLKVGVAIADKIEQTDTKVKLAAGGHSPSAIKDIINKL